MAKTKILYCYKCGKKTIHKLAARESIMEGTGIARLIACVCSFGATETSLATKYYQCENCGEIIEE